MDDAGGKYKEHFLHILNYFIHEWCMKKLCVSFHCTICIALPIELLITKSVYLHVLPYFL
jgi:hypothetical protein